MAVVVKWKADGEYLSEFATENGRPIFRWSGKQKAALRFKSRSDALRRIEAHRGCRSEVIRVYAGFWRIVPNRRVEAASDHLARLVAIASDARQKAPPAPSEPTARASMAGDADERWQPGAVWEHRGAGRPAYRYCLVSRDGDGRVRLRPEDVPDALPLSPSAMTPENGWRYIGRPASAAKLEESVTPAWHAVTHGGVTVTAPETMTLGDVWAALSSSPALRVCLDGETRRAREDGVVEGLRRGHAIVRDLGAKWPMTQERLDTFDALFRKAIAGVSTADRQPHVDRVALLALAEGWEIRGNAFAAEDSTFGRGRGQGLLDASVHLKRLLSGLPPFEVSPHPSEPPRGPGGGELEPSDMRAMQDAGGGP